MPRTKGHAVDYPTVEEAEAAFLEASQNGAPAAELDAKIYLLAEARRCQKANGHDKDADEPPKIGLTFYRPDKTRFATLPPRAFIYRRHYMRKMLSVTASSGGTGKSSLILVELASIALGVDLLNDRAPLPAGAAQVWYHNGEDPADELDRRIAAICKHYELDIDELAQTMMWTSGRDVPLIVAEDIKGSILAVPDTTEAIAAAIRAHGVAVLCLDPLISTHRVNENDNGAMDKVLWQWRKIAEDTNCAIEAVHHFRKTNGNEPSMDDIRGASSLTGAARSARILASMAREEAVTAGVDVAERRRFMYEVQAKANMYVAADERIWRELVSVDLDNACDPYESDKVGVAAAWTFPTIATSLTDELFSTIMGAIRVADQERRRENPKAKGWVGALIADTIGADIQDQSVRKQIAAQVAKWTNSGLLNKYKAYSSKEGKEFFYVSVQDRV